MNRAFTTLLTARLVELTEGLVFYHKPTEELKAPKIIGTMLAEKQADYKEAEEFPFVRWVVSGGEFARMSTAPFSVMLDAGIYTNGTVTEGCEAITELVMALGKVVEKPWFSPYKLRSRVRFVLGDPDNNHLGMQPHPYYYGRLYLEFVVARGHGG